MADSAIFKVSGRAMVPEAKRAATAAGRIRQTLVSEFRGELKREVELAFQDEAPKGETGELADSIEAKASFTGGGATITVRADPVSESGFHYLDVTRRGRGPVVPKRGRAIAWESAEHPVARVGPYVPAGDWVDRANRAARPVIDAAAGSIGRKLRGRVL